MAALLILVFLVKLESPKYYLMADDEDRALQSIRRIYHRDEDPEAVLRYLKNFSAQEQDSVTIKQALCDRDHNRVTYFLMAFTVIASMNGGNIFLIKTPIMALNEIFKGNGPAWLTDSFALTMRNVVDICAQPFSIFLVSKLRRRYVFMGLGCSLVVLNILLGLGDLLNNNVMAFVAYLLQTFAFEIFTPVQALYVTETTTNGVLSVTAIFGVVFSNGMTIFMLFYLFEVFALSTLFFACSANMVLCTAYVYFFLRETSHLTDKEKKKVYKPKY